MKHLESLARSETIKRLSHGSIRTVQVRFPATPGLTTPSFCKGRSATLGQ
jgi:hypothetical protein